VCVVAFDSRDHGSTPGPALRAAVWSSCLKIKYNVFSVVKVNCSSSFICNDNQTHLNIEKGQKRANWRKSVGKCSPEDLFTFRKSITSYQENHQNILVCWLYLLAVMTYKVRVTATPTYLSRHLTLRHPAQTLRSSDVPLLIKPFTRTEFVKRAFRHSAPTVWNSLPKSITNCDSLPVFKCRLKTYFSV